MELKMSSANNSNSTFQDFPINVKLIISSLWVAVMFCYVYGDYIEVYVPGVLAEAMEVTQDKEGVQLEFFAVALLMSIPSVMIFLTRVLKPTINRWLNIVIPTVYIALLVAVNLEATWVFYLYLTAIEILLSISTVWYAWNWPKTEQCAVSNG
jgi:small-conductance mechanosensitive channel